MEKHKTYTIAAVQATPVYLDRDKTVEKACDLIIEAGKNGAELAVFPEAFISGYPDWVWVVPNSQASLLNELYTELVKNSLSIPDEYTERLCRAAKTAKVNVAIGLHERNSEASNASLYNTLLFIDNKGQIMGRHRKLIPTGGERLIWARGDGTTMQVFDSSVGKVGGLICWENYMPLARQAIYAGGTQILAAPTWDKSASWQQSMQYIAREGGMYVVSCCSAIRMTDIPDRFEFKNLYPENREWINTGNSCIINPKGEIIAGPLEGEEGILYAEMDPDIILASKRMFDVTGHYSRPDVFQFGVNKD